MTDTDEEADTKSASIEPQRERARKESSCTTSS
jgi:hypothetical protein